MSPRYKQVDLNFAQDVGWVMHRMLVFTASMQQFLCSNISSRDGIEHGFWRRASMHSHIQQNRNQQFRNEVGMHYASRSAFFIHLLSILG